MKVTKLMTAMEEPIVSEFRCTPEQLQNEFDYLRAEKITKKMLDSHLVSTEEFDRIMAENRRSFSTFLLGLI